MIAGFASSSLPVPLWVISPVSRTKARCARASAWFAFCSTSSKDRGALRVDFRDDLEDLTDELRGQSHGRFVQQQAACGPDISARPMASICCSPPDMVPPHCFGVPSPRNRSNTRSRSALIPLRSFRPERPHVQVFHDRHPGKDSRPFGCLGHPWTTRMWAFIFVMSSPSNLICCRRRDSSRPEMVFMVVVLPAPLAPIRETISPP